MQSEKYFLKIKIKKNYTISNKFLKNKKLYD